MRRSAIVLASVVILILVAPGVALAYDEINYPASTYDHGSRTPGLPGDNYDPHPGAAQFNANCARCHGEYSGNDGCESCHYERPPVSGVFRNFEGPHGFYTTATNRCALCHETHVAGGPKLLMAATMTGSCYTCHDGTGGQGVYGSIRARLGQVAADAAGGHGIDVTNTVPGGDAASGGSRVMAFKGVDQGAGGTLTCADCHTPHGQNMVNAFVGERANRPFWLNAAKDAYSTKMLKQRPGNAATPVLEYGSDWCLACHAGRSSGGAVHNHPVDYTTATRPAPYTYKNLPVVGGPAGGTDPQTTTRIGPMAYTIELSNFMSPALDDPDVNVPHDMVYVTGGNGYVMPYPRTAHQAGIGPICQQCHEDTREPGYLTDTGAAVVTWTRIFGSDGLDPLDNPRFQNFPHETENAYMTLESGDDLCTNCHPSTLLP